MLLNEAIMGRHSIRSFRPDPVEKSLLLTLADAAQQAPSASNLQAWRFLFITAQQLKEKLISLVLDFQASLRSSL